MLTKKILDWVHEDPNDIQKIANRALIVVISPLVIGGLIAAIIIEIIKMGGGL